MKKLVSLLLALVLVFAISSVAMAATYDVTDSAELEAALAAVGAGDTINLAAGTYTLEKVALKASGEQYNLPVGLSLIGEDGAVINGSYRFVGENFTIKNIDFVLDDTLGGTVNNALTLFGYGLVEDCDVTSIVSALRYCQATGGKMTFSNCVVTAEVYGINFNDGNQTGSDSVDIINCELTGWNSFGDGAGKVTVKEVAFGEGAYNLLRFYEDAVVEDCEFHEDMRIDTGDGGVGQAGITVELTDCVVTDNPEATMKDIVAGDITEAGKTTVKIDSVEYTAPEAVNGATEYATLEAAIADANDGDVIVLRKNVELDAVVEINDEITIDGAGKYGVTTSAQKAFEVYADATFQNIKIESTHSVGRCVDTRTNVELTLDNVELIAEGSGNTQPLTISDDNYPAGNVKATVAIKDSKITASDIGYAVIVFVESDITIENSELTGYAALYFKEGSEGSECAVTDSVLTGVDNGEVFGTVVIEAADVTVDIKDSTLKASGDNFAICMSDFPGANFDVSGSEVSISGESVVDGNLVHIPADAEDASLEITGGTFTDDAAEDYLAPGYKGSFDEDGNLVVTPPPAAKRYDVNVAKTENGDVAVKGSASYDSGVVITATPHYGYEVGKVVVTDADGDEVKVTKRADGTYSFSMPRGEVSIKVTFVPQGEAVTLVLTIGSKAVDVNGKVVTNDVAPVIKNSRTFLPVRLIAENLGASVIWDEPAQRVAVMKGETTIELFIGKTTVYVNGQPAELEAPVFIENSRTYLPVRFIAEKLGADVEWNGATNEVTITGRK